MDSIDIQKQNYWISKVVLLLSQFLESCFELTAKLREQDPFRSCENHKHPVDYYTKSQSITFLGLSPVFFSVNVSNIVPPRPQICCKQNLLLNYHLLSSWVTQSRKG